MNVTIVALTIIAIILALVIINYYLKYRKKACRYFSPLENFDLDKFMGRWYEIAFISEDEYEEKHHDISFLFTPLEYDAIDIMGTGYRSQDMSDSEFLRYIAKPENKDTLSCWNVFKQGVEMGKMGVVYIEPVNYNYCMIGSNQIKKLRILSRHHEISQDDLDTCKKEIENFGYSAENLVFINHIKKTETNH